MSLRLTCLLPPVHVLQMGETEPQWICQKQEETGEREVVPWLSGLPPQPQSLGSSYIHCHCAQKPGHCWKEINWALVTEALFYLCLVTKSWLCCSVVNSNRRKDRFFCAGSLFFLL